MIFVFLAISIGICILAIWNDYLELAVIPALATIVEIIAIVILISTVSELKVIDEKIDMYQSENEKIEAEIAECVANYMEYESDTIESVSNKSAITLVTLYPELKSDSLVQKQIELYTKNNSRIRKLKSEKIDGKVSKWWLYFGG